MFRLTIESHPEDGGYLAYVPTLPGCQTWGGTYEAASRNAKEALAVYIETLTANADPLPKAPLTPLAASGSRLWGEDSARTLNSMRREWRR